MTTLLLLKTSIFGDAGQSSRLAERYVRRWRATHPHGRVVVRDLAVDAPPHLTAERMQAFASSPEARTSAQQEVLDYSDALIAELRAADEIVLTAPMYNFGIPSALKAYFDHVARAGVTFRYTANGPIGLLTGKKVHVIATRGGYYAGSPQDHLAPYLTQFLAFIGLTDVEFIYSEGLAVSAEHKERGVRAAEEQIDVAFGALADAA